jgi:hypothetical protein
MRTVCLALLLASAFGCTNSRTVTNGIEEPSRMVEVILTKLPVGTPIEDAQVFMEREGFKCSSSTNAAFGDRTGLDYVTCDRLEGSEPVRRRWQVAVVHQSGKVVEVLASTGLIGL